MPKRALIDVDELKLTLITGYINEEEQYCYPCKKVLNVIDQQPIIEERTTGKWVKDLKSMRWHCDQCLSFALKTDDGMENLSDFCPVCGADMRRLKWI